MANFTLISGPDGAGGITTNIAAAVDRLRGAQRTSVSPLDCSDTNGNLLGHYRTNLISGATVSIASNGPIASMRWAGPLPPIAVILRISAVPVVTGAITAATVVDLECIFARNYTVADTGGTATTPIKLRSTFQSSSMADMRVATTAALTAGTRTLDSVGFGYAAWTSIFNSTATGTATAVPAGGGETNSKDLYKWDTLGGHPPCLSVNEGIVIRQSTAGPTTGSIRWAITVEHCELPGF